MKILFFSLILLNSSCIFCQSDSLNITDIRLVAENVTLPDTTVEASVMYIEIRIENLAEIGLVTIDILSARDNSLVYKREYFRETLDSENLWTETGLLIKAPIPEDEMTFEIRATFQNLQMAFIGQLINNYPFN